MIANENGDVLSGYRNRLPYLSVDNACSPGPEHPQLVFSTTNGINEERVSWLCKHFEALVSSWEQSTDRAVAGSELFSMGISGMQAALRAVSATTFAVSHAGRVIVERRGSDYRRFANHALSDLLTRVSADSEAVRPWERRVASLLALLGISGLPPETINFVDVEHTIPILARMMSRVEMLGGRQFGFHSSILADLRYFSAWESAATQIAGVQTTVIACGTRARVYVPSDVMLPDPATLERLNGIASRGDDRDNWIVRFFSDVWRNFADEGLLVHRTGNRVHAYALVGGACFRYFGEVAVDHQNGAVDVRSVEDPTYLGTCGDRVATHWRRRYESLSFASEDSHIARTRRALIHFEGMPEAERDRRRGDPTLNQLARYLLHRQVNFNLSHVLQKRMERFVVPQWAPNMSRDCNGVIINAPHAMGGVGEMFRAPLTSHETSSQIRVWRELDGTLGFRAMPVFLAYQRIADEALLRLS